MTRLDFSTAVGDDVRIFFERYMNVKDGDRRQFVPNIDPI
jgi:hypothetical protein